MLQNANTKCNGLMPLWGPEVSFRVLEKPEIHVFNCTVDCLQISDSNFTSSLARYVHVEVTKFPESAFSFMCFQLDP